MTTSIRKELVHGLKEAGYVYTKTSRHGELYTVPDRPQVQVLVARRIESPHLAHGILRRAVKNLDRR